MTERARRVSERTSAAAVALVLVAAASFVAAEIVNFSADTVRYRLGGRKEAVCSGHATISNAENTIRADRIVITGEGMDEAKCYKTVRIHSRESGIDLTAEYVEYHQKSDYIRLLEQPVLTMKGLRIASDEMERYNGLGRSVIRGETLITRSNLEVRCRQGRYDERRKVITLQGAPVVLFRKSPGESLRNSFSSGEVVFFNTNNRLILNRRVQGKIYFDE